MSISIEGLILFFPFFISILLSLYTGITNSNGIATVTVSNVSSETVFTCSYSNVSDTCTVTVQQYLFYDACDSASGLSQYGEGISLRNSAKTSLAYNSSMNAYTVSNSAQGCGMIPITVLNGENNFKIEFDWYSPNGDVGGGFAMKNTSTNKFHYLSLATYNNRCNWWNSTSENYVDNCLTKNNWHHITLTVTSSTVTYDFDNGVATGSYAVNITMDSNVLIGIESQWAKGISGYIKNIKVESL